jgi:hypothetical protein
MQATIHRSVHSLHCKNLRNKIPKRNAFVLRHRQIFRCMLRTDPMPREVTMPAIAEVLSTSAPRLSPRGSDRTTCPVCADSMVAAEASAFVSEHVVSYLWTCDTCGYGFVTNHSLKRFISA